MASRTRLISVPPARGGDDRRGFRQLSGSMGASMAPDPGARMAEGAPAERFEAAVVPDDDWSRTIAMREQAEGLQTLTHQISEVPTRYLVSDGVEPPTPARTRQTDLSSLPDRFELVIERKNGSWKITSPLHAGLWRAGDDLAIVIKDSLAALAVMIAVDGPQPRARKRRNLTPQTDGAN
jgi:hypothetical protein